MKSKLHGYGMRVNHRVKRCIFHWQRLAIVNGAKTDWAPVVSGVLQGAVIGPCGTSDTIGSLYINFITVGIESETELFSR